MKYIVMALLCLQMACGKQNQEDNLVLCGESESNVSKRCSYPIPPGKDLSGFLCSKVADCHDVEDDDCQSSVYEQQGLSQHTVLNVESFKRLDDIVAKGNVQIDWAEGSSCYTAIEKISCDEFKARNYISIGNAVDYSNIHKVLDVHDSCKSMFKILSADGL